MGLGCGRRGRDRGSVIRRWCGDGEENIAQSRNNMKEGKEVIITVETEIQFVKIPTALCFETRFGESIFIRHLLRDRHAQGNGNDHC